MLERLNEELRRRSQVVRIFPNVGSCMRLIRALCVETHEGWLNGLLDDFLVQWKAHNSSRRGELEASSES